MVPFAIISDSHNHNFSAFSQITEEGLNSRLDWTLREIYRCAETLYEVGGDSRTIYHTGDLFHVRGSIAPSVLNPTRDMFERCHVKFGTEFVILAGNHDLEHKHSSRLGNAVESCRCDHVKVISSATDVFTDTTGETIWMIPWHESIAALKEAIQETCRGYMTDGDTLMIHAPIDGVIPGLPDHGLSADYLGSLGFKRVFSGHYHNHKDFGNGVYSVGALTHQTWSDVGSKAGFLIATDEGVKWYCTHAPRFVEIDGSEDPVDAELKADGNFVKIKLKSSDMRHFQEVRDWLTTAGAEGIQIDKIKEPTKSRRASGSIKAGASVEVSIAEFIKSKDMPHSEAVQIEALKLLGEVA